MSVHQTGRHRAPSPLNPVLSLSAAISRSAKPASKASAMMIMSGALVASFALPASAASAATPTTKTKISSQISLVDQPVIPSAAQAPLVPRTFGQIGFAGVVKPKPKPRPRPVFVPVPVPVQPVVAVAPTPAPVQPVNTPAPPASVVAPAPVGGGVLAIAASLAGVPYVYGGTTTAGFDCSGFTQYVFARLGISIPRTAAEQQAAVTPVTIPQPGDLVFFGSPAYHVAIYAGNGMMWAAPHTGAVVNLQSVYSSTATYGRP
jgi:cell wall-associated NlpC family hydrolase